MAVENNVFYWNTADNEKHSHKRIEGAIERGYVICINININEKLYKMVKKDDIILSYEPKCHKLSKFENGDDGLCMDCKNESNNGLQAFTHAFGVLDSIILNTYDEYLQYNNVIFRNWYSTINHCKDIDSSDIFYKSYFDANRKIYLFQVKYLGPLTKIISTNKNSNCELKYYGNVRRGFGKVNDKYILLTPIGVPIGMKRIAKNKLMTIGFRSDFANPLSTAQACLRTLPIVG